MQMFRFCFLRIRRRKPTQGRSAAGSNLRKDDVTARSSSSSAGKSPSSTRGFRAFRSLRREITISDGRRSGRIHTVDVRSRGVREDVEVDAR
jgi:hypothetical protein